MRGMFTTIVDFLYALSYHISILRSADIAVEDFVARHLHGGARYKEPKRLNRHEFQMFSQSGADGIIAEIFRRVGQSNSTFAEFGVGNGLENNTTALLLQGWSGTWIEASKRRNREIGRALKPLIDVGKLDVLERFVTRENIVDHFDSRNIPLDLDLLSIDIDGNDYWVFEAIDVISPRIVVVEYNGIFGTDRPVSIPYQADFDMMRAHHSGLYFGASLPAMISLAERKGYDFVGTTSAGADAFFVRRDVAVDLPPLQTPALTEPRFRRARDEHGNLTYLAGVAAQRAQLRGLVVVDVVTGEQVDVVSLT